MPLDLNSFDSRRDDAEVTVTTVSLGGFTILGADYGERYPSGRGCVMTELATRQSNAQLDHETVVSWSSHLNVLNELYTDRIV